MFIESCKYICFMKSSEASSLGNARKLLQLDRSFFHPYYAVFFLVPREMLAGVNPIIISLLEEFPPKSKLDTKVYGNQNSAVNKEHIEHNMEGLTIEEALRGKRLFILNHHDTLMPYLRRINSATTKTYASRTVLLLKNDGTLNPLEIDLSLPHPYGDQLGAVSKVCTPAEHGVEGSIWQLAKAYVAVNDSGVHQLISHWLNTRGNEAICDCKKHAP